MTFQNGFIRSFVGDAGRGRSVSVVKTKVTVTRAGTVGTTTVADLTALGREGVIMHTVVRQDDTLDDAELGDLRIYDTAFATVNESFLHELVGLEGDATAETARFDEPIPYEVSAAGDLKLDFDVLATRGSTTTSITVALTAVVLN